MCGRYTRYLPWSELVRLYRLTLDYEIGRNDEPRYNIAPTEEVPFVTAGEDGNQKLRQGRWWLVPFWAKEMPKAAMFNARIETVDSSPAFRDAFKAKRCLIPADGFYEWTKSPADDGKDPWHIFLSGHAPFSFAGLWAHNSKLDVTSCTIITEPATAPMTQLHDRQPVILDPAFYDVWLDPRTPSGDLKEILSHELDGDLQFHRVGRGQRLDQEQAAERRRSDDRAGEPAVSDEPSQIIVVATELTVTEEIVVSTPAPRKSVIYKHWCDHAECKDWGYFGFDGRYGTLWYCGDHRAEGEAQRRR